MCTKKRKTELSYPSEKDEPPFICRLYCSSYSVYAELSGWSSLIPTKLGDVNLNETTCLANLLDKSSGRMHPKAREWLESQSLVSIRQASQFIGRNNDVTALLMVQVVAKRKVEVITIKDRVFLISTLIVADSSGYCLLTCMNEGLKVVYNCLDVGDVILLTRFKPQKPKEPVHIGLFSTQHFVNMEVKVAFHTARHHYHFKFDTEKQTISSYFKMAQSLYDEQFKLFLPNELQALSSADLQYFDLAGVISYVGRIQRHRVASPVSVESVDNSCISLPKFVMYRWIKLCGKTGNPLQVKIYIYNQSLEYQPLMVPGAHVVITHCVVKEDQYTTAVSVVSSEFSHIFVEQKVATYFRHRPLWMWNKAKEVFGVNGYISVLTRVENFFSVSGTLHVERVNESKFLSMYNAKQRVLDHEIDSPMKRRESRYVFVKGRINRAYKVEWNQHLSQHLQVFEDNHEIKSVQRRDTVNTPRLHQTEYTWLTFIRKLPDVNPEVFLQENSRNICERVVKDYERYCGPLLLPATNTAWGELAHLKFHPQSYIEVVICNEQSLVEWRCIWKQPEVSNDERISRIKSAANKTVICLVEAFSVDDSSSLELTLIDFVVLV